MIAEIEVLPIDKTGAEKWAIDNAKELSALNAVDLASIKHLLVLRGARTTFLDRELPKILKGARPPQPQAATGPQPSWSVYRMAIKALGYTLRMNDLDDVIEVNGTKLSDGIEAEILMKMHDAGHQKAEWVTRAIKATAHQNRYHPVKEFLESLQWDGQDWIAGLEYYVRDKHPQIIYGDGSIMPVFGAWLKRWGIGAVGKVLQGGKLRMQNPMLVLIGDQDAGKSTMARWLCPMSDEYFIESHISPDNKDHDRYLATKLTWEVAELGATTRKADREGLKSFLTRQDVTFRVPYARHPITKPALASFIGTINPEVGFLNDPTGHRRFLPVEIEKIDFGYQSVIDVTQLWAQFVALYKSGESAALTPEEKEMANKIRNSHETEDNFTGFITKYYDIDLARAKADPANQQWSATTTEIVEQLSINDVAHVNVTNIGLSLRGLGLARQRQRVNRVQETRWFGLYRNNTGHKVKP